jgi:hypothetical protein
METQSFFKKKILLILALALLAVNSLWGEEPDTVKLDDALVVTAVSHKGYYGQDLDILRTLDFSLEAVKNAVSGLGIRVVKTLTIEEGEVDLPELLHNTIVEEKARWGLVISTEYREEWLFWSISRYDGETGFSRVMDAYYVPLLAGVSARNAIEASALRVAGNWGKISSTLQFDGYFAVSIP